MKGNLIYLRRREKPKGKKCGAIILFGNGRACTLQPTNANWLGAMPEMVDRKRYVTAALKVKEEL